jgi:hypothetical protein
MIIIALLYSNSMCFRSNEEIVANTRILQKSLWMLEHFNSALPLVSDMVKDSALHLAIN